MNKKRKQQNLSRLIYWMIILGSSLILSATIIYTANEMFSLVKPDITATVTIPENATKGQVARILKKEGVIGSTIIFNLYETFLDKKKEYRPGTYELSAQDDYRLITAKIKQSKNSRTTVKVVIPEGYTLLQTIRELNKSLDCTEEELLEAANSSVFEYDFLAEKGEHELYRLEGYLFPDTYEFYTDESPVNVIDKFLKNFGKKYDADLRTAVEESAYTPKEVLTIAGMVEKEAKKDDERAKIAAVIYNRLKDKGNFPYLQIDATLLYTQAEHKTVLTNVDKELDTPYNTYKYKGLPPGPICSPGLKSLAAAINPEPDFPYYYYNARKDGSHYFSKTLNEHIANINKAASE